MPVDLAPFGARSVVWVGAQLHLLFAAFVLGAPIFIVICEYLGVRQRDGRFERLAHETMKVVVIAYSLTALTGALFTFTLLGPYRQFSGYLFVRFYPVFALYGVLILVETLVMYLYWYTWEPLARRKRLHIAVGVLLNVLGTIVMVLMNGVGSFMLTPPENAATTGLWDLINNATWSGLNLHRFIANITFGGFMVALMAATMFLTSSSHEDRAFYDWMGFIGNLIGVGTLMLLPVAGYIYARELFLYDAAISTFLMADKLSWFFEVQGILVSLLFLAANYYMWLSARRITGGARFATYMKAGFVAMVVASAVWITPQNFLPDLTSPVPLGVKIAEIAIPERAAFLGLMMAKGLAVTAVVALTFLNYLLYRRALTTGSIRWGDIDHRSQYTLIALPALAVYTMGLMGAIRELARQDWHVFRFIQDTTPYWYAPSLAYTSLMVGIITLIFFALMAPILWLGFRLGKGS
ncbi:MAG: cytochrome ubiquinol oxidase subunit I [Chloroflexi bacterium]|nr:cytochrome ubiquinol oxidase subunit I [Chloroflexota bacterium]